MLFVCAGSVVTVELVCVVLAGGVLAGFVSAGAGVFAGAEPVGAVVFTGVSVVSVEVVGVIDDGAVLTGVVAVSRVTVPAELPGARTVGAAGAAAAILVKKEQISATAIVLICFLCAVKIMKASI